MLSWLTQHYKKNVDAMEQICLESDATSYKFSLLSFQFIISVVIIQFVLGYSRALSVALQVVDCDLIAAHDDARTVVRALENLREGTRYQQLYDIALHPIFRTGLLLSLFILLVRLGTTPPLAYPKDLFLGLFSIFCLLHLLASWSLASHSYADDVQSYKHCSASEAASAIRTMSRATDALNSWMSSNRLLLNPHKTQYIWLATRQQLYKLDYESLSAEFPTFLFSTSVRDLGVILDQELSFAEHITALTRSCYYHLRQLRVVSRSLSSSSASTLIHAFIANRLDYCSSLYCGLPQVRLQPLNGVLRAAACMIGGVPNFGHISHYMPDVLQWLPVQQRIHYT